MLGRFSLLAGESDGHELAGNGGRQVFWGARPGLGPRKGLLPLLQEGSELQQYAKERHKRVHQGEIMKFEAVNLSLNINIIFIFFRF